MRKFVTLAALALCVAAVMPAAAANARTAKDATVSEGIHSIQVGIQSWAVDHHDTYPPLCVVRSAVMLTYVDNWPINPWTHRGMRPGTRNGYYTYRRWNHARSFKLVGHLSHGNVIVVP